MGAVGLSIFRTVGGTETLVARANKWKFQDTVMGEQFITCTITSEIPIDWALGDYCEFRGETYMLNYTPTVTQKAPSDSVQDAYTYENIKFDSQQDELTRCMMLDVTPTTPEYQAVLGTNHTGSSRFQLYCGETTVNGSTLTAVCALALKMQANLDRLYPNAWHIYVDTTTTYETSSGENVLVTHTDSKLLTFDNQTVAQALGLVHTEFKLDYCIRGRNIYIGYSVDSIDPNYHPVTELTADDVEDRFAFGYGRGYPSADNPGKGLFQIKQVANSQQKIVTRLRALGSTKNLPYNYYFKKYSLLSQALFPNNLQLPGTFLPLGLPSDTANADGTTKWAQNNARSQYLRKVLGDTNDAYIDKNDDAAGCVEGIREDCARWDGSNGDLPEIYPTIEGVTFGELRDAGIADQTGAVGDGAYQGNETKPNGDPVQPDYERIDNILAVGYTDGGVLIDDANVGDGIMPENEVVDKGTHFIVGIGQTKLTYNPQSEKGDFEFASLYLEGEQHELFTVKDVTPGQYYMSPTGPSYECVAYRFSLSAGGNVSANVGFVIRIKQKVGDTYTTIAEWYSDFTATSKSAGEQEMYLPEIPDQGTSGQVETITVTEPCDVVVTFAPIIDEINAESQITLTYQVGRSLSGEYDPEYNWCAVQGDVASKYPFHVFIKDMGFDLTATFNGETPVMAMRSGACVGREFQIGENVQPAVVNGIRGYLLTLNRVEDSDLHIYYPNQYYPIAEGDYFVLLNINMPDAYIRAAELRLLKAATDYLADNCETKYTYQPFIDEIYLQRNIDENEVAGTRENSIFWRLYAGLRFTFDGIPSSDGGQPPLISMTIEQVTITMGEGLAPKVDMVLNDEVQQTTLQKLTVAVDRIYNGSAFSMGGAGTSIEAITDIGNRLFLSRTHDDTANGRITFNAIATFLDMIKAKAGINIGEYLSGFLGSGAHIGADGRAEFEEVTIRGAVRAAEIVFNRISAEEGEAIRSIGHGEILEVDETNMTATLKLEGDEWPTIDDGDICRGLYNTIEKDYDNSASEGEDNNGFRRKQGFFASYFKVEEVLTRGKGECSFRYSLQPDTTEHPCPLMKFAAYGNDDDSKPERQSCMYITAVGIAPRLLFLAHVNDWRIKPENIKVALGNINQLEVYEKLGDNIQLKVLEGDAGLFVEDNIYLGGIINQFTSADWQAIQDKLGQGIHAQLLRGSDNIVVDALGNVVGGIYEQYGEGQYTTRRYKLHTGVMVFDSGKGIYLSPAADNENIGDNEFAIYHACYGCTALRDGADFYITHIDNTNDGLSGSVLTDDELIVMRDTEQCGINFTIKTANGWKTHFSYPIKITHLNESYITFDLDNEFDSMSYRSQTKRYAGLPIETNINAYVNGQQVTDFHSVSLTSDLFEGTLTTDALHLNVIQNLDAGLKVTLSNNGNLKIEHRYNEGDETDLADAKHYFYISAVVKYAGALYESGVKQFVVQEITDATLYKLLLSANAISKDGGTYIPASIDVNVQITDNNGVHTHSASSINAGTATDVRSSIKVWYLNGAYNPDWSTATLRQNCSTSMPEFANVTNCMTILIVDDSTDFAILDIESVTINAIGRDGAGQPWIKVYPESVYIDCDSEGNILVPNGVTVNVDAQLYWGETIQELDYTGSTCEIYLKDELSPTPVTFSTNHTTASRSFAFQGVLSSTEIIIYLSDSNGDHSATKTIPIVANRQGIKGDSGAALVFCGDYLDGVAYHWTSIRRDYVLHGGLYCLVNVPTGEEGRTDLHEPIQGNTNWLRTSTFPIIATNLLLAENATINLLGSNIINLFDENGRRRASINHDGKGSYCNYYPSGNKLMEFATDGFIHYYYDNEGNSEAWRLGYGGDITKFVDSTWEILTLCQLGTDSDNDWWSNALMDNLPMTDYWQFHAGASGSMSEQDGKVCVKTSDTAPINALVATAAPDGWYTPDRDMIEVLDDNIQEGAADPYVRTVYHIVNGFITTTTEVTR